MRLRVLVTSALLVAPAAASAQASDSVAVARAVAAFHDALASGDSAKAMALLADDVLVLESGSLETRAEYREHHLAADMVFAAAVPSVRSPTRVTVRGDVAWVVSTSQTRGTYREREVNSSGAELMVLTREAGTWRISAIHWSSRAARLP